MRNKIMVISADAMTGEDVEVFKTLPAYTKYLKNGAEVKEMRSIYPALTYPAHATLATGVYPDKHGILTNGKVQPCCSDPDQNWYWDDIKVKDIFSAVKEKGYSTGTVNWTSMGNNPAIDYLVDECWINDKYPDVLSVFKATGANDKVLEIINNHLPDFKYHPQNERWHPGAEQLIVDCTKDIMKYYQPDFMMIHISNIDGYKHVSGISGALLNKGIHEMSDWLCDIFENTDVENTDIFMVSDHGQMEYSRRAHLNTLFRDKGWITCEGEIITDWKVYAFSNGHSSYVFLNDMSDLNLLSEVGEYLHTLSNSSLYGIQEVFSTEEAEEKYRLNGSFAYIVEGDGCTAFDNSVSSSYFVPAAENYHIRRGAHGYEPEKGPQPFVLAKGPHIRNNTFVDSCNLIDIAPTLALITKANLPDTDGKPVRAILREEIF